MKIISVKNQQQNKRQLLDPAAKISISRHHNNKQWDMRFCKKIQSTWLNHLTFPNQNKQLTQFRCLVEYLWTCIHGASETCWVMPWNKTKQCWRVKKYNVNWAHQNVVEKWKTVDFAFLLQNGDTLVIYTKITINICKNRLVKTSPRAPQKIHKLSDENCWDVCGELSE